MRLRIPSCFTCRAARWILTLVLGYAVFVTALALMQKRLMYFPDPQPFAPAEWALKEMELLPVKTADGLALRAWYHPPRDRTKFTIVFMQGNAGHLGYRNYKIRPWLEDGYGVLLVGYRGFGNPGRPSEEGLYADARAAILLLKTYGTPEAGMVLFGESMGTGVATQMATEFRAAALVLEAPYTSIPDVASKRFPFVPVRYLLRDRYDSLSKIAQIGMPLLILHGEDDTVVPVRFGKALLEAAREPKQGFFVAGAGHNDIYDLRSQQIVARFLENLPTEPLLNAPAQGPASGP